jgi:hypothetical protein
MRIFLEMLGAMKKPFGQGPVDIDVDEDATVRDLMTDKLSYRPEHVERLSYFVNGERIDPDVRLKEGCRLRVLMIIGGG